MLRRLLQPLLVLLLPPLNTTSSRVLLMLLLVSLRLHPRLFVCDGSIPNLAGSTIISSHRHELTERHRHSCRLHTYLVAVIGTTTTPSLVAGSGFQGHSGRR